MSIRPFDWRDIPTLHRYRNQCVVLHNSLVLTRGRMFIPGAMLSTFTSATGIVTSVSTNGFQDDMLIGQSVHSTGSQFAQMTFLAPESSLDSPDLSTLLEYLAVQMGERGAYRLLAEIDEGAAVFEALHRLGFAIYSRQRVWKVSKASTSPVELTWQPACDVDVIGVNSLYHNVVPGLVQQVEPVLSDKLHGLLYRQADELLAYAQVTYGHRGIWIQPIFHPDAQNLDELMAGLIYNLPNRLSRPVYVGIRSYISWMEPVLEELGAIPGPSQAVMVKHLAVPQRAIRSVTIPALETGQPEVSAPFARSEKHLS
jgi:hypothetical protein